MELKRKLPEIVKKMIEPGKATIIYGARRTGKTTLLKNIISDLPQHIKYLFVDGGDADYAKILSSSSFFKLNDAFSDLDYLFIDEAQMINNIGQNLKLLVDHLPNLNLVVTGSSNIDMNKSIGEPLLGRSWTFYNYPLSLGELMDNYPKAKIVSELFNNIIYGSYPGVVLASNSETKQSYLREITNTYLYKDILDARLADKPLVLRKILELLAYQIGSEVSLQEIATKVGIDRVTVGRYLSLMESSFIIFKLSGYSGNMRNEVTKFGKYYFWDTGIRNSLINNFSPLGLRPDTGALWENYLIAEKRKLSSQPSPSYNDYFWRTHTQQEIDYIITDQGKLNTFEFKFSAKKMPKLPKSFAAAYPNHSYKVITPENILEFLSSS